MVRGERDGFLVASDGRKRRGANRIKVEEAATNNLEGEDEGKGTGQGSRCNQALQYQANTYSEICGRWEKGLGVGDDDAAWTPV